MWTLTIFAGPWHRYVGHVGWTKFVANLHSVLDGSADIEARKRSYVETRECFSRNWFFNCQLAVSILKMECRLRWVFFHFFWPSEIHREFVAIEPLATYNRHSMSLCGMCTVPQPYRIWTGCTRVASTHSPSVCNKSSSCVSRLLFLSSSPLLSHPLWRRRSRALLTRLPSTLVVQSALAGGKEV